MAETLKEKVLRNREESRITSKKLAEAKAKLTEALEALTEASDHITTTSADVYVDDAIKMLKKVLMCVDDAEYNQILAIGAYPNIKSGTQVESPKKKPGRPKKNIADVDFV